MSEPKPSIRKINDAERLRSILITAKDAGNSSNQNLFIAWAKVFEIDDSDSEVAMPKIVSRIAELRRLNEDVIAQLESIPEINADLYSEPLLLLRKVLSHQSWTSAQWSIVNNVLTPVNMRSLEYIVDAFGRRPELHEQVIPPDELSEISKQIADLYAQVRQSKLKKALKDVLMQMLHEMEQGIHEYNIGGVKRLKQHLGSTYAAWLVYQEDVTPVEKKDGVVTKVLNLATKLVGVADSVSKTASLLGPAIKGYLGSSDNE